MFNARTTSYNVLYYYYIFFNLWAAKVSNRKDIIDDQYAEQKQQNNVKCAASVWEYKNMCVTM